MADIDKGLVDAVVVYKVDRLTRSLADFAKMVEVFDARGVSFVAVTQQFNTTTSMGRLTLNVLLSFAQFEREVTGERIRDKIAASKRKGIWMGGLVPLGYEVRERQLVINEAEATTVRHIFTRYCGWKESIPARDYLRALRGSVMSLYEVVEVKPGRGLVLRDLVRVGEPVEVDDQLGSQSAAIWDRIAARVLSIGGWHYLSGSEPSQTPGL
jgi:DNA invertase Pin-like site-specific DNA recombinase